MRIPGLVDGRGKLFYFANYSYANDAIPGKIQGSITVPANPKHLAGDFSDLLTLPNPAQYRIYDPLTTRPDPLNPSRMIRDPFPNNTIPRDRIFNPDGTYKSPLMALYSRLVPAPNQNFVGSGQQPSGNFYQSGQPDSPKSQQYGVRVDFNASSTDRVFFRGSGVTFLEYVSDWTYQNPEPELRMHSADRSRYQWSYTGTWTRTLGAAVLDTSVATNRFNQVDKFLWLKQFTPSDAGLPSYLDEFCSTHSMPASTSGAPSATAPAAGTARVSSRSIAPTRGSTATRAR